jgi:uncharacterized protein (UPF0332 family)
MADRTAAAAFLAKAELSLAGAESEFANRRYDNCANRAYYACFQAAIAALLRAGIGPNTRTGRWRHDFVQAAFAGELVNRRKVYSTSLRTVLSQGVATRHVADYRDVSVGESEAANALLQASRFLAAVSAKGDRT